VKGSPNAGNDERAGRRFDVPDSRLMDERNERSLAIVRGGGGLAWVVAASEGDFGRARRVTRAFNGRPQRERVSDLLNSRVPSRKRGGNDSDGN